MKTVARQPRRVVAAYDDYADAQKAVDHLSDHGFPLDRVAIVGHGLRYIEQIAGRLTGARAAMIGALEGAGLGALFALLLAIFFTIDPNPALLLLMLYAIVVGALLGAILGALLHAATQGRRDFASFPGVYAERYEVVVDEDVADRALELLRSLDSRQAAG